MKRGGGCGTYSEINRVKDKMKDVKSKDYFDVLPEDYTNWDMPSNNDNGSISPIDLDCLKKSIDEDYHREFNRGPEKYQFNEAYRDMLKSRFWYDDPAELIDGKKVFNVLPSKEMSYVDNLNAIARLGLYIGVIMIISYHDWRYAILIAVVLMLTVYLFMNKIHSPKEFMDSLFGIQKKRTEDFKNISERRNAFVPDMIVSDDTIYRKDGASTKKQRLDGLETVKGRYAFIKDDVDMVCAGKSQNESTGGYDWIKESSHADFMSNNRLLTKASPEMKKKIFSNYDEAYGREIADRNSFIAVHPRDYINTAFENVLYGKNLDRRLYNTI